MLTQKLQEDLTTAMKARQQERVDTIRLLLSEIKNAEIDKQSSLSDEDVIAVLKKQEKKLKDALEMFEEAKRDDLVDQYKSQIAIIQEYLPAELSDAELSKAIAELKEEHKDVVEQNPNALIGIAMKELSTRASPDRILQALK